MPLTTEQAAQTAGVKAITIRQNILRGNLAAQKHGRDWSIDPQELARWAQTRGITLK